MSRLDQFISELFAGKTTENEIKDGLLCFSKYDLKEQFPFDSYPERTVFGKKYLSNDLKGDKTKSYLVYKALTIGDKSIEADRANASFDPDNSMGSCEFAKDIYSRLWGFEYEYGYFGQIDAFKEADNKKMLFGGDCLNSLQTSIYIVSGYSKKMCLIKMAEDEDAFLKGMNESPIAEVFSVSHAPGNFGLVPAYFNGFRGMHSGIRDYLPQSLFYLTMDDTDFSIIDRLSAYTRNPKYKDGKAKEYFQEYSSKMSRKYINTMFLWDLISYGSDSKLCVIDYSGNRIADATSCYNKDNLSAWAYGASNFIRRRGIFISAMLYASYFYPEEFKNISSLLYVDNDIIISGKHGYEGVFLLLEENVTDGTLKTVFNCAKELIMELKYV